MHLIMSYHILCIHDTYVLHTHAIDVPKGVTLLEYDQEQSKEQQAAHEQEVQVAKGEVNEENLPKCLNH
jgi:hypothetical protein